MLAMVSKTFLLIFTAEIAERAEKSKIKNKIMGRFKFHDLVKSLKIRFSVWRRPESSIFE
jgi:hypothetical protein